MYISKYLLILSVIVLYWLWLKVSKLEKWQKKSSLVTKIRLQPKSEFYDIPIIRKMVGIKNSSTGKLSKVDRSKISKFAREKMLNNISFHFFYDKDLVFCKQRKGSFFIDIPENNDYLLSEAIGEIDDIEEVELVIKLRDRKNIIPNKTLGVYTCYLKTSSVLSSEDKIIPLFEFPELLVNPNFSDYQKNHPGILKKLEKKFSLVSNSHDAFGEFINDFGETQYYTGGKSWHESKYFKISY